MPKQIDDQNAGRAENDQASIKAHRGLDFLSLKQKNSPIEPGFSRIRSINKKPPNVKTTCRWGHFYFSAFELKFEYLWDYFLYQV